MNNTRHQTNQEESSILKNMANKFSKNFCEDKSNVFDCLNKRFTLASADLEAIDTEDDVKLSYWKFQFKNNLLNIIKDANVKSFNMFGEDLLNSELYKIASVKDAHIEKPVYMKSQIKRIKNSLKVLAKACNQISKGFSELSKVKFTVEVSQEIGIVLNYFRKAEELLKAEQVSLVYVVDTSSLHDLIDSFENLSLKS